MLRLLLPLSVAFLDLLGIGLLYPILSSMFFDHTLPLLPHETSHEMRGCCLGVFLSLTPLAQFFSSPIWGALSDTKGRKSPLINSLLLTLIGYLIALLAVYQNSLISLLVSRLVIGTASGNISIVQAAIADCSTSENKAKHFGLYSMACGVGFTLGPFFGGTLSLYGYAAPFFFTLLFSALNLVLALFFFKETNYNLIERKVNWTLGITHLKKAFHFYGLRTILLVSFLHQFGWSYFFEFSPVYLILNYQFSPKDLGIFFGVVGAFYALSAGLLIRPFVNRFKSEMLIFGGNLLGGAAILAMPHLPSADWLWPLAIAICFFIAFVSPCINTFISNHAGPIQGEALGILSSINAAALILSPLFSGSLVGANPTLPMRVGGPVLLLAAIFCLYIFRGKLFRRD